MNDNKICGIYVIKNILNSKIYVGQSEDIHKRWKQHIKNLNNQSHPNNHLQNAWNKYGEENFKFSIVEVCDENELNDKEIYWIKYYNSFDNGYNLTKGGDGVRGMSHTDETKNKISNTLKEKFNNNKMKLWIYNDNADEIKIKIGNASRERLLNKTNHPMYGKHHSDEAKNKISNANSGRKKSDELKKILSKKFSGENNPMYGIRLFGKNNPNYGNHKLAGENNPRCRAVYCPELDESFWGAKEAQDKYGFNKSGITSCCTGKQKSAGKHPETGEPLHWKYI